MNHCPLTSQQGLALLALDLSSVGHMLVSSLQNCENKSAVSAVCF